MKMDIRKILAFQEEILSEAGQAADVPLRKVAVAAIVRNEFSGKWVEDLSSYYEASDILGRQIAEMGVAAMKPYAVESYGKAAVVGVQGEQEHGVALLTTVYGNVLREAVGGGAAWISSVTKRAQPGASIDIPLAYKDALYVRSHYDAMSITLHDAPLPHEIAVICCFANRGRLNHRVGGPSKDEVKGKDGLT
jgi:hypothetical protein